MRLTSSSSRKKKASSFLLLRFVKSFSPASKKNASKPRNKRARSAPRNNGYSFVIIFLALIIIIPALIIYKTNIFSHFYSASLEKFYKFTANIGLKIDDVFIEGRHHVPHDAILQVIQASRGKPILTYDIHAISEQIKKIDWVKSVVVQRRLPGVLYIKIQERQPIAVWKHQNNLYLVDTESIPIREKNLQPFSFLPVIVGADAPSEAPKILAVLKKFPIIYPHVTSLARIRKRRWDILISNHTCVKLPEGDVEHALKRLSKFLESNKIPLENILLVDLRIPKRIILETSKATAIGLKIKGKET